MLITTCQHLKTTHDAKKKKACKTNKRTTPAGDISKVGRVLEQKYINYNFDKKLRQRTFKLKEALLGRSEPGRGRTDSQGGERVSQSPNEE